MQKYSSANTSINSKKLPAIYGMKKVLDSIRNKNVIDIGGGKFDNSIDFCKTINCNLQIYDKYNRTSGHNKKVLKNNYDFSIISNVLNVIDSKKERANVLKLASEKSNTIFITVYEGDKSGIGKETKKDCFQLNRKTDDYIVEIKETLPCFNVKRHGKLIICEK